MTSDTASERTWTEDERDDKLNMVPFPPPFSTRVKRICLTGGPCGGKTTALSQVADRLRSMGIQVFVVPENATTFSTAGAGFPGEGTADHRFAWECEKLHVQVTMEDCFARIAQESRRTSVIIFDRGCMDTRAYCGEETFAAVLRRLRVEERELCEERYDAVVHLVTTALGAESYYSTQNNTARRETLEEARQVDAAIRVAWRRHPRVRVIENPPGGMEAKTQGVVSEICQLLGVNPPRQGRAQFLVSAALHPLLATPPYAYLHAFFDDFLVEVTFLEPSSAEANTALRRRVRRAGAVGDADVFAICSRAVAHPAPPASPLEPLATPHLGSPVRSEPSSFRDPGDGSPLRLSMRALRDMPYVCLGPLRHPIKRPDALTAAAAPAEAPRPGAASSPSASSAPPTPAPRAADAASVVVSPAAAAASPGAAAATPTRSGGAAPCDSAVSTPASGMPRSGSGDSGPHVRFTSEDRPVTRREYEKLLSQADPACAPLRVQRRCFCYMQHWFQLDHYADDGLTLVDVELPEPTSEVPWPKWLVPHVERRITGSSLELTYQAYNIARQRGADDAALPMPAAAAAAQGAA